MKYPSLSAGENVNFDSFEITDFFEGVFEYPMEKFLKKFTFRKNLNVFVDSTHELTIKKLDFVIVDQINCLISFYECSEFSVKSFPVNFVLLFVGKLLIFVIPILVSR